MNSFEGQIASFGMLRSGNSVLWEYQRDDWQLLALVAVKHTTMEHEHINIWQWWSALTQMDNHRRKRPRKQWKPKFTSDSDCCTRKWSQREHRNPSEGDSVPGAATFLVRSRFHFHLNAKFRHPRKEKGEAIPLCDLIKWANRRYRPPWYSPWSQWETNQKCPVFQIEEMVKKIWEKIGCGWNRTTFTRISVFRRTTIVLRSSSDLDVKWCFPCQWRVDWYWNVTFWSSFGSNHRNSTIHLNTTDGFRMHWMIRAKRVYF